MLEPARRAASTADPDNSLSSYGMSVTRTPLTLGSITSAALQVPISAWTRRVGSSKGVSTSSRDVSRSGFRNPCREHPAIHPPPGQQLEQFARTQGRAAGGVQITMDRGEEQAHGIPGGKAVKRCLDRAGSARNEPVAIVLMPSRRDHFPETPARVGQSCRKLSMSGSSGASLAIRCDKRARVSPTPKGGARVCVL
jgi:hypothetical protein